MLDQHCIAETLSHSEAVETLRVLRTQAGDTSRSAFARHVCRELGFVDSLRILAKGVSIPKEKNGDYIRKCRKTRVFLA